MTLVHRIPEHSARVAILPGSFNPPTRAHVELARSALNISDAVVFVVPREFPHKDWSGATLDERIEMLRRITATEPRFGIGIAERGLYIDMAREARDTIPDAEIELICGNDAAERIATWDYGEPGVFDRMLDEFRLLVAPRSGQYPRLDRVHELPLSEESQAMSATEVRARIQRGEAWQHLVPAEIRDLVATIYS